MLSIIKCGLSLAEILEEPLDAAESPHLVELTSGLPKLVEKN